MTTNEQNEYTDEQRGDLSGRLLARLDAAGVENGAEAWREYIEVRLPRLVGRTKLPLGTAPGPMMYTRIAAVLDADVARHPGDGELMHFAGLYRALGAERVELIEHHAQWLAEHGSKYIVEAHLALAALEMGREHGASEPIVT